MAVTTRFAGWHFVTTGVTTDVFDASAGDALVATFEGIGAVELTFS